MKHFLLLIFAALLGLSAGAQTHTYTDNLVVDLGGKTGTTAPITATVYLTEHDGKVDLELRNFVFKVGGTSTPVGHIKLSDLTVTPDGDKQRFSGKGKAKLTRGDLPGRWLFHGRQPELCPRLHCSLPREDESKIWPVDDNGRANSSECAG